MGYQISPSRNPSGLSQVSNSSCKGPYVMEPVYSLGREVIQAAKAPEALAND